MEQVTSMNTDERIDVTALDKLYAIGNTLYLSSNSYYSYMEINGNTYACVYNGKAILVAFTEDMLDNKNNVKVQCRENTSITMSILSSLAQGSVGALHMFERSSVKEKLGNIGIEPGEFKISVDGKAKTFYLGENGSVYSQERTLGIIKMYNSNTWLNERSVGDTIMVFGKKYEIDETGHINVPTEGFWVNEKCNYGI